jgi:capsular exopolysaccharide synthesis family protein
MEELQEAIFESDRNRQGLNVDFKRVAYRALSKWYLVALSLFVAIAIAFFRNRYTERVYPVYASILIREREAAGGADLLYSNPLVNPYRNYLNEPYIIRSYPLIEKVVGDNNFHVSFYREGYFMTTESYNYIPVQAELLGGSRTSGRFVFQLRDVDKFQLSTSMDDESSGQFAIGDSISFNGFNLRFTPIPGREIEPYIDVPFNVVIRDLHSAAEAYIRRLQVEWAEQGAGIINLSIKGTNPEKEIDFLNSLISSYQKLDLDKKNETAERTIEFIRGQLISIKDSLSTVEFQLERFGNNSRVKDMTVETQRLLAKMEELESQKAELLIRQSYFKYLEDYLASEGKLDQVILPSSIGMNDQVLNTMLGKLVEIQLETKLYLDNQGRINPLMTKNIERIDEIRKDVQESLNTLKSTDQIRMDFINKQVRDIERQLDLLPASERRLVAVQRNYSLLENLYVFLMQKLSEAEISKASSTSDIVRVNPAMRGGAISPKPTQNYIIAIILGLSLPAGVFVLLELLNTKVQSKQDITKMTKIPFIGGVGHNSSGDNRVVSSRSKSVVAESFRALRSNLNYFTGNKNKQIFMVSSSVSGEGKTFTTINLATVFALSGKRTLMVGADMRRPKIFADFKGTNAVGLSTFLAGTSNFNDVVQKTDIADLLFVSGGPVPPNPSELLLTDRFELFIKNAVDQFDFVIIDTPPLALVTDAFVISKFVNHTVFVFRQNYSRKDFVRSIDEYYRSGKLKNISILLNDISKSGLGYGYSDGYGYNYGYSYRYGSKKNGQGYYEE